MNKFIAQFQCEYHCSADVPKPVDKDPEMMHTADTDSETTEVDDGFAIVIHGHSLVFCLGPELEDLYDINNTIDLSPFR